VIVDSHAHIGTSAFSGVTTTEDELLRGMDENGIDMALVMPQPSPEDYRALHDRIAAFAQRYPDRIRGIASISPFLSPRKYVDEARRCVCDLGFVGLKLHPLWHAIAPNKPRADIVFHTALELGVPVIVHTGLGAPNALPALCIPPARKYPRLPIILAHAGYAIYTATAIVAAEVCPNIYLEPSWCGEHSVRGMIHRFGARRVLFGSDHVSNLPVELAKYRSSDLSDEERRWCLGETARTLFHLD